MKNFTKATALLLSLVMLQSGANVYAFVQQDVPQVHSESMTREESDQLVLEQYVHYVNSDEYENITELFSSTQRAFFEEFFSNSNNQVLGNGIYNVTEIKTYSLELLENDSETDDQNYSDIAAYLVYLECSVKESNQFFKEGDNYLKIVIGSEDGKRVIIELSVASDLLLDKFIEDNCSVEGDYEKYLEDRAEIFSELTDFEVVKVTEKNIGNDMGRASFSPKTISSYSFPSTIKVLNSTDEQIHTINFRDYCNVVCASEFGVGTDGTATVHMEALKAFSLCVRNFGWYRALYPYNATAGYNVTDNSTTQVYKWSLAENVETRFPRHVSAMTSVWNVMMFDGAKKLFIPAFRAGSYNGNQNSTESRFYQNGSNYLATELGYTYDEILHYYYDPALGTLISSGPIIVCESHFLSLTYTKSANGHGRACLTCGYIQLTPHTWVNNNNLSYSCSVCGYETTDIPLD